MRCSITLKEWSWTSTTRLTGPGTPSVFTALGWERRCLARTVGRRTQGSWGCTTSLVRSRRTVIFTRRMRIGFSVRSACRSLLRLFSRTLGLSRRNLRRGEGCILWVIEIRRLTLWRTRMIFESICGGRITMMLLTGLEIALWLVYVSRLMLWSKRFVSRKISLGRRLIRNLCCEIIRLWEFIGNLAIQMNLMEDSWRKRHFIFSRMIRWLWFRRMT